MNLSPLDSGKTQYVDGTRVVKKKSHFFIDFSKEELEQNLPEKIDRLFIHCINQKNGFRIKAYDHPALSQLGFRLVKPKEENTLERKIADLTVEALSIRMTRLASQITRPLDLKNLYRCFSCFEVQISANHREMCNWPPPPEPPKPIQEYEILQTLDPHESKISLIVEGETQAEALLLNGMNRYMIRCLNAEDRFQHSMEQLLDEIFLLCSERPFGYRIYLISHPTMVHRMIEYGFEIISEPLPRQIALTLMRLSFEGLWNLSDRLKTFVIGGADRTSLYECTHCNSIQERAVSHRNCHPILSPQRAFPDEETIDSLNNPSFRPKPLEIPSEDPDEKIIDTPKPMD